MNRRIEQSIMCFCWKLPRIVIYWCLIRGISHATTGVYRFDEASKITASTVLARWRDQYGG